MQPFIWKTRLLFVDTDASGRIHYSALFRHVEAAEMEFFRSIGRPFGIILLGELKYPRVHVEADYKAPLRHDDELEIDERLVQNAADRGWQIALAVVNRQHHGHQARPARAPETRHVERQRAAELLFKLEKRRVA